MLTTFVVSMGPGGIAMGPDGNLCFVENEGSGACAGHRSHHALGPDGNLWFTEWKGNNIGRLAP
jgi:hypothetical protein